MVSNNAWDRLSEAERESRRLDGPALVNDLTALRGPAPFDLADLKTPSVYVHGDGLLGSYYRNLCREITAVNASIASREMTRAGHGAHLSSPDQLAALLGELWDQQCASA
jgi:pimeloyl-ACP methyl ester carboxylesterase